MVFNHVCDTMFIYLSFVCLLGFSSVSGARRRVCSWCNGSSDLTLMVDALSFFLFQPLLHDWCNKGCGMCKPVCGMVHVCMYVCYSQCVKPGNLEITLKSQAMCILPEIFRQYADCLSESVTLQMA